jgi:hypothetical protein
MPATAARAIAAGSVSANLKVPHASAMRRYPAARQAALAPTTVSPRRGRVHPIRAGTPRVTAHPATAVVAADSIAARAARPRCGLRRAIKHLRAKPRATSRPAISAVDRRETSAAVAAAGPSRPGVMAAAPATSVAADRRAASVAAAPPAAPAVEVGHPGAEEAVAAARVASFFPTAQSRSAGTGPFFPPEAKFT